MFPLLRDEPVFYRRHFRRWVDEGMKERSRLLEFAQQTPIKPNGL